MAAALRANNVILPSGQIESGGTTVPVQTVAVYRSLDSIRQIGIPVVDFTAPGGRGFVWLGDIATITEAPAASTGLNRTDGRPSVDISAFSPDRFDAQETGEYLATTIPQSQAVRRRH